MRRLLPALLLPALLAAWVDVSRPIPPLAAAPDLSGVGLVQVDVDPSVAAGAPKDFADIADRVAATFASELAVGGPGPAVQDYRNLGFQAKIEKAEEISLKAVAQKGAMAAAAEASVPYHVRSVAGLPAGVQTPLVTVFKVLEWRTGQEKYGEQGKMRDTAKVSLIASTWTTAGTEVLSQMITVSAGASAIAESGRLDVDVQPEIGATLGFGGAPMGRLAAWYQASDGRKAVTGLNPAPKDRVTLMNRVISTAVGIHAYAFRAHELLAQDWLVNEKGAKEGVKLAKAGDFAGAATAWEAALVAEPDDPQILYDLAIAKLALGKHDEGVALLEKAAALKGGSWAKQKLENLQTDNDAIAAYQRAKP
jgi:hypothetical protein